MTPLKTFRQDLGDHIADGLDIAHAPLGAQLNPPAVVIQHGFPYLTASTYCADAIQFQAVIVAPPGDPAAVADALDDLVDLVRITLGAPSYLGHRYGFEEVSGPLTYGDKDFPAVAVTIGIERDV